MRVVIWNHQVLMMWWVQKIGICGGFKKMNEGCNMEPQSIFKNNNNMDGLKNV